MDQTTAGKFPLIKNIYLYLVCFVSLLMMAISAGNLISSLLRTYVFTKADYYGPVSAPTCATNISSTDIKVKQVAAEECAQQTAEAQKANEENRIANLQRDVVNSISFFLVGLPLFIFHWRIVKRKDL